MKYIKEMLLCNKMSRLYTKKGDTGYTSLYGGRMKAEKSSVVFNALGDLDELSSHIGLLCAHLGEQSFLRLIQVKLIDISSNLATLDEQKKKMVRKITEEDVNEIENKIDEYEEKNGKLTEFLLPGSTVADSQCHVCRSVSRRAERSVWNIHNYAMIVQCSNSEKELILSVDKYILQYMNRLSDFFFALARKLSDGCEIRVSEMRKET